MTNNEALEILKTEWDINAEIFDTNFHEALALAIKVLEARPQGEWIGNAFDEHHCNKCGHYALQEEEPDGYYEVQSNFCPNCGADMREKEGNDENNR